VVRNHTAYIKNEIQRSYLQLIIMHLKSIFNLDTTIASSSKSKLAYDFRKELELNFYENHKVGFYAEKLNISVSSLNKKVKEVFNMSPSEMVLERLLLEAKRLLYYNEYSSKEIAYKLGYNDDSYFSRIFKQKIGLSPNQFRKDSRQEFK
jgi:AraC-like DNA-binding protein